MPKLSQFIALPMLASAFAFFAWGQGATHPGMSLYAEPSFDRIERAVLNPKTNTYDVQRGWLMFDSKEQVRFVSKSGNQLKIPYKSIKSLEFSFYNPVEMSKSSRPPLNAKIGGKRYLVVHYDLGSGAESSVLGLEPEMYQQVIGSFQSKTGMMALRPGGYEKRW